MNAQLKQAVRSAATDAELQALGDALDELARAHEKVARHDEIITHARDEVAGERDAVKEIEVAAERAIDEHAARVEAWLMAGALGEGPKRLTDAKMIVATQRAKDDAAAAERALASLEIKRQPLVDAVTQAEAAVAAAELRVLRAESDDLAEQAEAHESEALLIRWSLAALHGLTMGQTRAQENSALSRRALRLMEPPPPMADPLPRYWLDVLNDGLRGSHAAKVGGFREYWAARIKELRAGRAG